MVDKKKIFLVQPVEHWKMPSWERNISENDNIQHTQIATDNFFSSQVTIKQSTIFLYE